MDDDALAELLASIGPSGEFAELHRRSGRLLNQVSNNQLTAAGNLLNKAARSISAGDAVRAERLIDRAAQMPYDPREGDWPGVRGAAVLIHRIIGDHFEASDPDDLAWLDVIFQVHPQLDPAGRAEVASVVHGFVLQEAIYDVTPAEARRIRRAFGDAPLDVDHGDGPDATVEQRRAIIRSLTTAAAALVDAFAAAADSA